MLWSFYHSFISLFFAFKSLPSTSSLSSSSYACDLSPSYYYNLWFYLLFLLFSLLSFALDKIKWCCEINLEKSQIKTPVIPHLCRLVIVYCLNIVFISVIISMNISVFVSIITYYLLSVGVVGVSAFDSIWFISLLLEEEHHINNVNTLLHLNATMWKDLLISPPYWFDIVDLF